jgi:hypothetical protein
MDKTREAGGRLTASQPAAGAAQPDRAGLGGGHGKGLDYTLQKDHVSV